MAEDNINNINEEKEPETAPEAEVSDEKPETAPEAAEASEAAEAPEAEPSKKDKKLKDEIKQLKDDNRKLAAKAAELDKVSAELADTKDKYLRVCAEYDNFRKRSQKERDGIFTDAYADALKEILPIFDNLERAAQYTEPDKLVDGLALIFKSAKETLTKLGVEEFGQTGDKFDPNLHNAVMHLEDETLGDEEIVEVFQKGYRKGERIIRHAMVKVAN